MVSPKYLGWASLPQFPAVAVCAQTCFSNYRNPLRTCCSPGPSSSPAAVRLSLSGLCPAPLPAAAPQTAAGPTAVGPPELPGPPSGCSPKKGIQSQGVPHLPIPGYGSQVTLHLSLLPSVLFPHPCLLSLFGLPCTCCPQTFPLVLNFHTKLLMLCPCSLLTSIFCHLILVSNLPQPVLPLPYSSNCHFYLLSFQLSLAFLLQSPKVFLQLVLLLGPGLPFFF